jgi:hypothetical protein
VDKPRYLLAPQVFKIGSRNYTSIPCEEVDNIVVNRLMEHVRTLSKQPEAIEGYEIEAKAIHSQRASKIQQLEKSILDVEAEQMKQTIALGKVKESANTSEEEKRINERMQDLILQQMRILEKERMQLIKDKQKLEEDSESDLGSLEDELRDLETLWPKYIFEKRRSLINFVVKEIIIDCMSTHWSRVQVTWLHEEWGSEEMYYYRDRGKQTGQKRKTLLCEHIGAPQPRRSL